MKKKQLFKLPVALLCVLGLGLAHSDSAEAASITFDLDCLISGPSCTSTTSKGSVVLTDAADTDRIDIVVTVLGGEVKQFWLNFTGSVGAGYAFASSTPIAVEYDPNDAQADGYNIGFFDLEIPDSGGSLGTLTYSMTLRLANGATDANLDVSMFDAKSTNGALYAAVDNTGRDGSGFLGSQTCTGCTIEEEIEELTTAPEPGSMVLLGSGLAALAFRRYRSRRT